MSRLSPRRAAAAIAIAAPLVLGGFILGRHSADGGYRVFQAVMAIVSRDALDSLTTDELYENAARGVVTGLDDAYADLYSAAEYARFNRNQLGNRYGGVGLRITRTSGWVTVWRVIGGGPAEGAGVQHGDRLFAVNDSSAQGWTTDKASSMLTGTPGTPVRATFERSRSHERYTVSMTRAVISVPAVNFQAMLEGNVGPTGEKIPKHLRADVDRVASMRPGTLGALDELLTDDEITSMLERARRVVERPFFPHPKSDYAYPWPMV